MRVEGAKRNTVQAPAGNQNPMRQASDASGPLDLS